MDISERHASTLHRHPWEISRGRSILSLVSGHSAETRYGDIGAGDLFLVRHLAERSRYPIYAIDVNAIPSPVNSKIVQARSMDVIPPGSLDTIFLMDVLEHVENDGALLQAVLDKLRLGGSLIITVPAHPSLFSAHDVFLKHYRRYTRSALSSLASRHHLHTQELFYFYTIPLVSRVIEKISEKFTAKTSSGIGSWCYASSHPLTRLLTMLLDADFAINRRLARWRCGLTGLSLCLVCQKTSA